MGNVFVCPRCGNQDPRFLGLKNGKTYCRKCISFCGEFITEEVSKPKRVLLDLSYSLSKEQKELSDKVIANFQKGIDTLIYAVCGSGKTEISFGVIGYAMSKGLKVGFALPRRDVVIELLERFKKAFPYNDIEALYGGHTDIKKADCLILTTHQLYRFDKYFDLLVMDELDAFPYKGNDVLASLFKRSLRGHCLMMSATPSEEIIEEFKKEGHSILSLYTRFHKQPIPVPKMVISPSFGKYIKLAKTLRYFVKRSKPCFVFVPYIQMAKTLFCFLSLFVKNGDYVSSKREGRGRIINSFKRKKIMYLVTTAVLERGVTIGDCQVFVFKADDRIYDKASLIQIAGRAGRKAYAPKGEVIFFADKISRPMEKAVLEIKRCNSFL